MITVNGKNIKCEPSLTIADYLDQNHYQINRIAVELNYEIIPKSDFSSVTLKDGDILEIVSFVGGG